MPEEPVPYWKIVDAFLREERNDAVRRLGSEAAQFASQRRMPEETFREGLYQLLDAYGDFLFAMNPTESQPPDYVHWHNHYREARLSKKMGEPPICQEILSGAAYKYLKGPLRVPMLDRGLLDAFIAQETFAFLDRAAGRGAFLTQVGCFGVWIIGSVLVEAVWRGQGWTRGWEALGGLLAIYAVIWAWPRKGAYSLFRQMKDTYQALTGSVVSVAELRRRIERARDRGVVWPAELYAVLDDVEGRVKVL